MLLPLTPPWPSPLGDRWGTGSIFPGMALLLVPAVLIGVRLWRVGGAVSVDSG